MGLVKFLGAAAAVFAADRLGRRILLLGGTTVMCLGHWGLAAAFGFDLPFIGSFGTAAAPHAVMALAWLLLFIFAWNISWAGLMLTIASEILPQPIRGRGVGMVNSLYWLLSFGVSQTFETAFESIGVGPTFAMYGTFTLAALGFAWAYVPETAELPLEALSN